MGTNTEPTARHFRETDPGTHSSKGDVPIKSLPSELRELEGGGGIENWGEGTDKGHQENKAL